MTKEQPRRGMDRRQFLRHMTVGAGATALTMGACSTDPFESIEPENTDAETERTQDENGQVTETNAPERVMPTDVANRTLVVVELLGGNDGLDTIVPYDSGAYKDLRPSIGVDLETVLPIASGVGLNPALTPLANAPLAIVQGVGTREPDLSHFESMTRWHQGNMTGAALLRNGFLGRVCDQLDTGAPVTGVSIDMAPSPALLSDKAVTLAIPDPSQSGWLSSGDQWIQQVRTGLGAMTASDGDPRALLGTGRNNTRRALDFLDMLNELPDRDDELYPGSHLSNMLSTTARLIDADSGIRVIHIPWGSFDTHDEHRGSHDYQLQQFGEALAAFLIDLENRGRADSTLVATISEFGRRPKENAGGTDHGAASVALLAGPVNSGLHGEYPSLTKLDDEDNLVATVGMDEYYASLAESWFGIPSSEVLDGDPRPLAGLI